MGLKKLVGLLLLTTGDNLLEKFSGAFFYVQGKEDKKIEKLNKSKKIKQINNYNNLADKLLEESKSLKLNEKDNKQVNSIIKMLRKTKKKDQADILVKLYNKVTSKNKQI